MARTKEFDPDAALQRALELFWERGYEATSMADLVARLGVARASIYATFGGKHPGCGVHVRGLPQLGRRPLGRAAGRERQVSVGDRPRRPGAEDVGKDLMLASEGVLRAPVPVDRGDDHVAVDDG